MTVPLMENNIRSSSLILQIKELSLVLPFTKMEDITTSFTP